MWRRYTNPYTIPSDRTVRPSVILSICPSGCFSISLAFYLSVLQSFPKFFPMRFKSVPQIYSIPFNVIKSL